MRATTKTTKKTITLLLGVLVVGLVTLGALMFGAGNADRGGPSGSPPADVQQPPPDEQPPPPLPTLTEEPTEEPTEGRPPRVGGPSRIPGDPHETPTQQPTEQPTESPTGQPTEPPPGDDPFAAADERMRQMVNTVAKWHAPSTTPVDKTIEVGLSIGDGKALRNEVNEVLPDVPTQPGKPIQVGTDVSARLYADAGDVSITPNDAIDASTGSDVALLWTWDIHPNHPTDELQLTVLLKMTVPGTDHELTKILHLHLRVTRTLSFTAGQVFTNYGTWAAILTAAAGAAGWVWRNTRRRKRQNAFPPTSPTTTPTGTGSGTGIGTGSGVPPRPDDAGVSRRPPR